MTSTDGRSAIADRARLGGTFAARLDGSTLRAVGAGQPLAAELRRAARRAQGAGRSPSQHLSPGRAGGGRPAVRRRSRSPTR